MANSKKYAYYNKGNKIALIEQADATTSGRLAVAHCTIGNHNNQADCEAAGGQWIPGSSGSTDSYGQYKSPVESIDDGLEIEYSYAPTYNIQAAGEEGEDVVKFLGWTSTGEYLTFLTYDTSSLRDITSKYTDGTEWIYVKNSGRWSGIHKVQTSTNDGRLITYTKTNIQPSKIYGSVNIGADNTVIGSNSDIKKEVQLFKDWSSHLDTKYVFIRNAVNAANVGFFRLASDDTVGQITIDKKYSFNANSGAIVESDASFVAETGVTVNVYNVFYEEIEILNDISVMTDETFEIDLNRKQSNAIIYYVRAKLSEDVGDMKLREYFMRLFYKEIEEASNARKNGPNIIQGFRGMRR